MHLNQMVISYRQLTINEYSLMAKKKIIIVGGGAGGLELATKLGRKLGKTNKAAITLVDRSATHIWKPLFHEVAAGTLNAAHDEQNYFIHGAKHHYEFQLGSLENIDRDSKTITLSAVNGCNGEPLVESRALSYDYLVLSVGSTCNDFGTSGAKEHCIYLDTRKSADIFHETFLDYYIAAHSNTQKNQSLSVAIIGAGATGVELSAELHHAAKQYVNHGLTKIPQKNVHISLIEAGPRILSALPEKIADQAQAQLNDIGVNVLTNEKVVDITADSITTSNGKIIKAPLKVWCAGIKAPDFLKGIGGLETNKINQLVVKPTLQTTRDDHIFAMGDCAECTVNGQKIPPRAQAAHQQASTMAKNLVAIIEGKALRPFVYKDHGSLVSLSKEESVGTLMGNLTGNINIHGWLAKVIYITLYRSHQLSVHGFFKTAALIIGDLLGRSTGQRIKLH